jgi:tRNA pseudouridine38-40 synthase
MDELTQPADNSVRTWKLTLAYDGTDFHGWQVQPEELTIQGELQSALGRITGESPLPQGSGRTDAGVHALAQVASFQLRAPIPAENLHRALNRTLPRSIRILSAEMVPASFHARHSALAKTYEYRIFRGEICPPFLARFVYSYPTPLNPNALDESARLFLGDHDFLSFAATDPDLAARTSVAAQRSDEDSLAGGNSNSAPERANSAVRTIFTSQWELRETDSGDLLIYTVRGNGFLHHMVRNLVGTMLDVGRGYLPVSVIPQIIAARSRAAAGPTTPARGLFLHSVEYPAADSLTC